jgi:membrane protease YdiL (CAAX protease family)
LEWRSVFVGAAIGLLLVFLTGLTIHAIRLTTGYDHPVYPDWVIFLSLIEVPLLALLGSILFAPLLEEILFRSMLYRGLLRSMALALAAVISALTFAAAHYLEDGGVVRAFGAAVMSLAAIWLFHRSRSLWPAIALHATFNGAVIVFGYVSAQIVGWGTTLT